MKESSSLALAKHHRGLSQTEAIDHYVAEINKHKLLSKEEETALAMRYKQHGDIDAAHQLVTSNLRFVVKIAHEYKGYGFRLLDLIQEGNIGLMMAVKKFDPERGYRLISYAVWWIRAYMQNFIVNSWSLVKVGTTQAQRKLFYKLKGTEETIRKMDALHLSEGEVPKLDYDQEVAEALGVTAQEVAQMQQRLSVRDASLDVSLKEGGKLTHLETLPSVEQNQEDAYSEREEQGFLKQAVSSVLDSLNPKERYIVEHRLMADEPMTLREIGEQFKISRERARQIESQVITKVKKLLKPIRQRVYSAS